MTTGGMRDHTSVLKLIEEKWNLPPLTRRDAAATAPLDALDLDGDPAFADPPDLPAPSLAWGSWLAGRPVRDRAPEPGPEPVISGGSRSAHGGQAAS